MHIPEIISVKEKLDELKEKGAIFQWELPYENLLTRLDAAIFFIELPEGKDTRQECIAGLHQFGNITIETNAEKRLSGCSYQLVFRRPELS